MSTVALCNFPQLEVVLCFVNISRSRRQESEWLLLEKHKWYEVYFSAFRNWSRLKISERVLSSSMFSIYVERITNAESSESVKSYDLGKERSCGRWEP
jgi:hypothetical protein